MLQLMEKKPEEWMSALSVSEERIKGELWMVGMGINICWASTMDLS